MYSDCIIEAVYLINLSSNCRFYCKQIPINRTDYPPNTYK